MKMEKMKTKEEMEEKACREDAARQGNARYGKVHVARTSYPGVDHFADVALHVLWSALHHVRVRQTARL